MTIKRRFLIFFSAYVGLLVVVVAAVSIWVLGDTLARVLHAENQAYAAIMGERILQRAIVGYVLLVLAVVAISLPIGWVLARVLSGAYLRIFENLTHIARQRLTIDRRLAMDDSERSMLQKYIDLLVADQEKLRDYERTKAWKDGARMLMHELKNPLTPLKLSAETLSLHGEGAMQEEVRSVLAATRDVEAILGVFKELVNLEFGPREEHELRPILAETFRQLRAGHGALELRGNLPSEGARVLTEPTLLRMAIANLANNGVEANPGEFRVELSETPETVNLVFITPHGRIADPGRIFHIRYSEKGPGRGYGLFLVRRIADYLDLDLTFDVQGEGVVFGIRMKKVGTGGA
jgi:two-component system nitrogen regulation sensor histidine kinase NtrY